MRRLILYGIVVGAFLACATVVVVTSIRKTRDIGASREVRGGRLGCGHWCVYRCSWMLGAAVDMEALVQMLPPGPSGHSLAQLRDVLGQIGFRAAGYKETFDRFRQGEFPCIVHLKDPDHFVLAAGRLKMGMLVFDGSGVRRRVKEKDLKERWTGNVLRIERDPSCPLLPRYKDRNGKAAPCIQFDTLHVDKGDVPVREMIVSFVYPFSNQGSQPLVVEDVHTDCKCLDVEKPEEPVPPGSRAQIVLKYHTRTVGTRGVFERQAVLKSNDPTYLLLPLHASGNSDVRVTFSPRVIDFGRIVCGRPAVAYCFIRYAGEEFDSFQITSSRCSLAGVECREIALAEYLQRVGTPDPSGHPARSSGRMRIVQLTYEAAADCGESSELAGTFEFETNVEDVGAIPVLVQGRVVSPVAAVPSALDFGELRGRPDAKASASLVLRSRDGNPFRVLRVESPRVGESLEYSLDQRGEEVALEVVCDEGVALEAHKSTLSIHLQLGDAKQTLVLPVVMYAWRAASEDRR